jgi:RNA polymerase sigma-70 factor (ECF subfamily)
MGSRGLATSTETARSFEVFAVDHRLHLQRALVAAVGVEAGLDAAAEALAYGWENWDRVAQMKNPGGYLYRVGMSRARSRPPAPIELPRLVEVAVPWIEPSLPEALASLPQQQRTAVILVHTYEYSLSEVAQLLGVAKGTVQTHVERALASLRESMGVSK